MHEISFNSGTLPVATKSSWTLGIAHGGYEYLLDVTKCSKELRTAQICSERLYIPSNYKELQRKRKTQNEWVRVSKKNSRQALIATQSKEKQLDATNHREKQRKKSLLISESHRTPPTHLMYVAGLAWNDQSQARHQ